MKNLKLIALATLMALPMSQSLAQDLSFATARALMHERADAIKMDQAIIEQTQFQVKEAKSLSGPKVMLNAQQVEGRKDIGMNLDISGISSTVGGIVGQIPNLPPLPSLPNSIKFSEELDISGPRASVDMIWPIYTGGAISAKQEATQAAVRQAQAGLDLTREKLDTELVQKYFGVQLARSVEALREQMLTQQNRDLNRAKKFEKAGMIAKIERMSAQVNRDTAERELLNAQTDRRVAETELNKLLKSEKIGALETPLFITRDLQTLSYWQDLALGNNPVLRSIDAQQHQARMGVKAAKGSFHPQVYAFGHYNLIKHYLTLPEPDWVAGIGVKITLWDNRDRSARVGSAQALVNKAVAAQEEARSEVKKLVEIAYLRSEDALRQYDLTASSIELARENLRLREKSFKEGLSTVDDVNDARNKLIGAEVAQRLACYRFVVAFSYLHAASGLMNDYQTILNRPDIVVLK